MVVSENCEIVIAGAVRTPIGNFQGELSSLSASDLGGTAIKASLTRGKVAAEQVDELLMGCVLPAGQGQAPARQAAFAAGLSKNVPCTTVNKMCGSGMKTVMMAYDQLVAGNGSVIVAGGMESMSNAPYLLPKMRAGARLGHSEVLDHMFIDGLEDAYDTGRLMGTFAEDCAGKYQFTREAQDDYALKSLSRASETQERGCFDTEIEAIRYTGRKGEEYIVAMDEGPRAAKPEKIPQLKPAFRKDGSVTAANSSSISDGAAALVVARGDAAVCGEYEVRARIVGHATHAQEPAWFTTAPVQAIEKLLKKIDWAIDQVDLWEINEAFAVVPMAAMSELGIAHDKLNVHGGACALGHPIGASGARVIVTLLHALETHDLKRGIAAVCIGGGEGTAVAIERV